MRLVLLATALGAVVGLVRRRRPRHATGPRLRLWPVLVAALVLQAGAGRVDGGGLTLLLASYVGLVAFAMANLATVGMGLVGVGLALNLAVIAANDGMPVRPAALVRAGVASPAEAVTLEFDGKRHLERPGDRLTALADIVPVPPVGEVVSFGDLVLAVGSADALAHLLRRRPAPQGR
jgi:hypothetical protein